jgi:hypothetical protein
MGGELNGSKNHLINQFTAVAVKFREAFMPTAHIVAGQLQAP